MTKFQNVKGSLLLILAALIWGLAFVAQTGAADKIPPIALNASRSVVTAIFLLGFLLIRRLVRKTPILPAKGKRLKICVLPGVICGCFLTVSMNLQQFGIVAYPAGVAAEARAGFLTALYVILVPIIGLLLGKKLNLPLIGAVLIATLGIYMLCLSGGFDGIYTGDILLFLCAISFALHILSVDRFGSNTDGILLSMTQFAVVGILSTVLSLCLETTSFAAILSSVGEILFLGIFSGGIAYTLQIVGQKYAEPTVASLSMSLESVFATLGGWLISGNTLTTREWFGCGLVFAAIVLAQLPSPFQKHKKQNDSPKRDSE